MMRTEGSVYCGLVFVIGTTEVLGVSVAKLRIVP